MMFFGATVFFVVSRCVTHFHVFMFSCSSRRSPTAEAKTAQSAIKTVAPRVEMDGKSSSSSAEGRFSAETVKINRMASKCFQFS